MKTLAFCLLFALSALHSREMHGQVDLNKARSCVDSCGSFFNKQQYTPLPDSLARCLEKTVDELKQAGFFFTGPYATSLFYHANQLSLTGYLRKAGEELHIVDSILRNTPLLAAAAAERAHTNNALSIVHMQLYEMEDALLYNEKALTGYKALGPRMHKELSYALTTKGTIAAAKGNIEEARMWADSALALWKTIPEADIPLGQRLNRLGAENLKYTCLVESAASLATEGGQQAALPQYRLALDGLRKVLAEAARFDDLNKDAKVATASLTVRIQSCFSNLRSAEPAWPDSILYYYGFLSQKGIGSSNASLYFGLTQAYAALAYAEKEEWGEAFALSTASCQHYGHPMRDIFDRSRLRPEQVQQKQHLIHALNLQAKVLQKRKSDQRSKELKQALVVYDEAFQLLDELRLQFVSESSREFSTQRFIPMYHEAAMAALDLYRQTGDIKDFEKAFQYAEQGKSFTLRNALRRQVADSALAAREKELLADIRDEELLYPKNPERLGALEKAYKELQAWRKRFKKTNPSYFEEQISEDEVGLKFVRQKLVNNDSTALIEFSVGNDSTLLLAVTKSKTYWEVVPHPPGWAHTLDQYCEGVFSENELILTTGFPVYKVLLSNMLERQLPRGIKRLILVPDGKLREVVFEGLLSRPAKPNEDFRKVAYLLRDYDFVYQYSLATYKYASAIRPGPTKHSVGAFIGRYAGNDPTSLRCSDTKLPALEAAARSAAAPRDKGKQPTVLEAATKADFMREARDFDELFFAAHGCMDPLNPLESSILFTETPGKNERDGRLTVGEVLGLRPNLKARLAVFGSCNTARGLRVGGEGVISLARAFAYAGVPATVAATTLIADHNATSELLKSFQKNLDSGMPKDKALAEAKRTLMDKEHPYYWLNFILIGDPAPMSDK